MSLRARASYGFKLIVSYALYYSGVLWVWQSIALRRSAVVLMYHRVLTADERRRAGSHPALVVERDTFARQMALVKRRFTVLSVAELADRMQRDIPLPDSSCVITFDDGWKDTATNALPVLDAHALPALVFLPVNFIGRRRVFWQEALTHLLERAVAAAAASEARRTALTTLLRPFALDRVLSISRALPINQADVRQAVLEVVGAQKALPRPRVEALVQSLARELDIDLNALADTDGFIDWADVAFMAQRGVTFGGHGADHLLLTQSSDEECEFEIRQSKVMLDETLKESVPTFSYPNGYFTPAVAERVRAAGYRLAFIANRGLVRTGVDRFTLRRINIDESHSRSMPMFVARLVGVWR